MMSTGGFVPVQVGQLIEFQGAESKEKWTTARVVHVDAHHAASCAVQVASSSALVSLDLAQTQFKIVFEVGKLCELSTSMIGWHIELIVSDSQTFDRAVIKRVDCSVNCALICFETGKKEWIDLSLVKVKVLGHQPMPSTTFDASVNATASASSSNYISHARASAKAAIEPRETTIRFVQKELPQPDQSAQVDWFSEGGHVELCDDQGKYIEGAILCSKMDCTLLLFNELHRFFEIHVDSQPFKAVLHGLVAVQRIPMGHTIEVYSAMHGDFHRGTVLKTAEVGKLTPVLFRANTVEWIDLSHQTFKLLFFPTQTLCHASSLLTQDFAIVNKQPMASVSTIASAPTNKQMHESSTCSSSTPMALASEMNHLTCGNKDSAPYPTQTNSCYEMPATYASAAFPILHIGQAVELYDERSRQFLKYKVIRKGADQEYEFQQLSRSSRDSVHVHTTQASLSSASTSASSFRVTSSLRSLRCCRIAIQARHWESDTKWLIGHRVDVYNKSQRSVQSGDVKDVNGARKELLVQFRDQSIQWINCETTKVKLRLFGARGSVLELISDGMQQEESVFHGQELDNPSRRDQQHQHQHQQQEQEQSTLQSNDYDKQMNTTGGAATTDSITTDGVNSNQGPNSEDRKVNVRDNDQEEDEDEDEDGRFFTIPVKFQPHYEDQSSSSKPLPVMRPLDLSRVPCYHSSRRNSFSASSRSDSDVGSQSMTGQNATPAEPSDRVDHPQTTESTHAQAAHTHTSASATPSQPVTTGPTMTLPAMAVPANDEIWIEEFDATTAQMHYVNMTTGKVQRTTPLWIKRFDAITREVYLYNTTTHTIALPVGPLEAVRVLGSGAAATSG